MPAHPTSRGPHGAGYGRRLRMEPSHRVDVRAIPSGPRVRRARERHEEETNPTADPPACGGGPPPINREITISEGITVKELSEKLGREGRIW